MSSKKKLIFSILLLSLVLFTVSAVSAGSFQDVQTAIDNAQEGSTIYLNNATYTYDDSFSSTGGISISKSNIVICGGSSSNPYLTSTLDGNKQSRIINVESGVNNIAFIGINFINGKPEYGGGAIYFDYSWNGSDNRNNFSFVDCTFINNTAEGTLYVKIADSILKEGKRLSHLVDATLKDM